ncbi:PsiF family protein [Cupriavidus pampae]|uniref:Phosphate starvation-inducible protein PsiF n=1 Tax=Cupriavidus pampae TaxID=659251 RepID=A0ABN7Y9U8_9BURK|nr:PsiF family protein [Cupriavidus pampae]CAG9170148.1 Phosphate starvation-inducible protein PsiF [Cupriavidus pampae]
MKKLIAMCVLVTPLIATGAFAQGASAPAAPAAGNTQQDRMKACNTQATGKKGDDRKKFMSDCLSGKSAAAAEPKTQQEKMSVCSKQGKGKKGDDYKSFMKDCLSKSA